MLSESGPKNAVQAPPDTCPLCNSRGVKPLCEVTGFEIVRCPTCCVDFVANMPTDSELRQLYDRAAWFEGGERGGYEHYDQQTEPLLPGFEGLLSQLEGGLPEERSILDIGCGYGLHLSVAARRGWKCFGVEVSEHARKVLRQRYADQIFLTDSLEHLIPHQFDLILLLDTIEHIPDPTRFFFELFTRGAIGKETRLLISTPNARSYDAVRDPGRWVYRHPPSHLFYYSAESLTRLLERLHFRRVEIAGIHPLPSERTNGYADEESKGNDELAGFAGIQALASGSDFADFMHERFVPGTWSKLAEYEHLPRYELAKTMASGARVLDFGCGTGYGSALLAETAESVLGVDIDEDALCWARSTHQFTNLVFERNPDLGKSLSPASFDLITCFEVIEHVNEGTQRELVKNFSALLKPTGKLLISTPNPAVTANYGENPYHLREMDEREFQELLTTSFTYVSLMQQKIQPSVLIEPMGSAPRREVWLGKLQFPAAAFVAVCSKQPLRQVEGLAFFDGSIDHVLDATRQERAYHAAQFEGYGTFESASQRGRELAALGEEFDRASRTLEKKQSEIMRAGEELQRLYNELNQRNSELAMLKSSRLYRLSDTLRNQPWSARKAAKLGYLAALLVTPAWLRRRIKQAVKREQPRPERAPEPQVAPYQVKLPAPKSGLRRPRVVHAIANFMLGGSSRLVVDLLEGLGDRYEQEVITSHIPHPPAYAGLTVHELHNRRGAASIANYLSEFRPALLHIHYWGECDKPWYENVFKAAEQLGVRVVENVNTPIAPLLSNAVRKYVFVSDYVRQTFGVSGNHSITIHPGTDFNHFAQPEQGQRGGAVGMVYRLESDKLNPEAIKPFIQVAQQEPNAKILIVGGGSLLDKFKQGVRYEGVAKNFVFTGYVPYIALPAYYAQMSIFVAPVWKESFGQVSPMAMNFGVPVVGYDVGALSEILGGGETLAPAGNATRLAEIILELLHNPDKAVEIGLRQQQRAREHFSLEAMVQRYSELYRELIPPPK